MIYLFENQNNECSIVFAEETLTNQQKARGVAIEKLPIIEDKEGMVAILKCSKMDNRVWYDYIDKPVDEIALLKEQLSAQQSAINMLLGV